MLTYYLKRRFYIGVLVHDLSKQETVVTAQEAKHREIIVFECLLAA